MQSKTQTLILVVILVVALAFTLSACGDKETEGKDGQISMSGESIYLLKDYQKYVNDSDWSQLIDLFDDHVREEMMRLYNSHLEPHLLGHVTIGDPILINNNVTMSPNWIPADLIESHDTVETYLAEVEYVTPSVGDLYEWVGLPFGQTKDRYLVFTTVKEEEIWKIYSITQPDDLTQAVEAGVLPYEETREGRLSTLDLQLFEEEFSPITYAIPGDEGTARFSDVNGFFRSFYSKPEEIDLEEFMRYFGRQNWVNENDNKEEFEEIARLYKEKTGSDLAEQLVFAPPIKYNKADVDEVLMKYAGITSDDLIKRDYDHLLYSEKYQAYYNFTSDFGPGRFSPDEGYAEGGVYTFVERNVTGSGAEGYYDVRTVFIREGDRYKIVSREIVQ